MLERSLDVSRHLVIAQGKRGSPVLVHKGELLIALGDDPNDYPALPGKRKYLPQNIITLTISEDDLKLLQNYFNGAPYPYEYSNEEIEEVGERYIQQQIDLLRGK